MESTAKATHANPTLEITIQAKQATNPDFEFLNTSSIFYPYYRQLCKELREEAKKTR